MESDDTGGRLPGNAGHTLWTHPRLIGTLPASDQLYRHYSEAAYMVSTLIIRDALETDLPACLALDHSYETEYVWQMQVIQPPGQWGAIFKTERLPRAIEVAQTGSEHRLRLTLPPDQCLLVAEARTVAAPPDTPARSPDRLEFFDDSAALDGLPDEAADLTTASGTATSTLLGYLSMRREPARRVGWIQDVVVDRAVRQGGIGTRLLRVARGWALEHGITRLMVETTTRQYPVISFCMATGFSFSGYNERYFDHQDITLFFSQTLR